MNFRGFAARCLLGAAALGALTTGAAAQDDNVFKLGLVAFLSGPAANLSASRLARRQDGHRCAQCRRLPKPYDKVGFGGLKIEVHLDRRGRRRHQAGRGIAQRLRARPCRCGARLCQLRRLPRCLAGGRGAQALLILLDCGTPRIFEENKFKYVFRTAPMARWITSPWPATW